jgi:hypothetical protein
MPQDAPVVLQQDNVGPVPGTGAGIRTILVTVMVNNVPTTVAMQAIAVADADGRTIDFGNQQLIDLMSQLVNEQRMTNKMLSVISEVPYIPAFQTTSSDITAG